MKNETRLKILSNSVSETEAVGRQIGQALGNGSVVALYGDLGAGKTALTRGIAAGWGSESRVTSPTFTLVNQYTHPTDKEHHLYHLDCYRLPNSDEAESIGMGDILAAEGAIVIEWAERVADWLPAARIDITLSHPADLTNDQEAETRTIEIIFYGEETLQTAAELIASLHSQSIE